MQSLSKFQGIFHRNRKSNPQTILTKRNKSQGIIVPDFKLYYKAIEIKTVWYWHTNRHVDLWKKIESPKTKVHIHSQRIFLKDGKTIERGKDSLFNNGASKTGCVFVCVCGVCSVVSNSLRPHGLCSPPGSSVHGIFQAGILEWVVISYSRGSSQPSD